MRIMSSEGNVRHAPAHPGLRDVRYVAALPATRIGGHAHRYLAGGKRVGRVASAFRNGLNVAFDEDGAPTWVSVQTFDVPLHPWAVEAPALPCGAGIGALISSDGELVVVGPWCVRISDAALDELRIASYTPEEAERALSWLPLPTQVLSEEEARRPADPFESEIRAALDKWQLGGGPALLSELVGLGSGSTPSGDDTLVGLLAALTAFSGVSRPGNEEREALRRGVAGACARTPQASWQMLAAAADGSFPEPLVELMRALGDSGSTERVETSAAHVAALGATSGRSILTGLAVGIGRMRDCRAA